MSALDAILDIWLFRGVIRKTCWIPDYFPKVSIRISKVSSISSVEGVLCRLDDVCPRLSGFGHHFVNVLTARNVVPDGE